LACVDKILILNYFRFHGKEGSLPNPRGPLSSKISSTAIVLANSEVVKVIKQANNNSSMASGKVKWEKAKNIFPEGKDRYWKTSV